MALVFAFYCVFTPLSTFLGSFLADTLGWNEYLVTILNMAANFILEYLYDRLGGFRGSIDTNRRARNKGYSSPLQPNKERAVWFQTARSPFFNQPFSMPSSLKLPPSTASLRASSDTSPTT